MHTMALIAFAGGLGYVVFDTLRWKALRSERRLEKDVGERVASTCISELRAGRAVVWDDLVAWYARIFEVMGTYARLDDWQGHDIVGTVRRISRSEAEGRDFDLRVRMLVRSLPQSIAYVSSAFSGAVLVGFLPLLWSVVGGLGEVWRLAGGLPSPRRSDGTTMLGSLGLVLGPILLAIVVQVARLIRTHRLRKALAGVSREAIAEDYRGDHAARARPSPSIVAAGPTASDSAGERRRSGRSLMPMWALFLGMIGTAVLASRHGFVNLGRVLNVLALIVAFSLSVSMHVAYNQRLRRKSELDSSLKDGVKRKQ